ncbi:MAG: DNA methyltransferase, partial [Verrucomicrobiae bacterium]|nr:DNA methyltransferase [Verrucomicrobiae bacterium]
RWFVRGQRRLCARIAEIHGGKLRAVAAGLDELRQLFAGFITQRAETVASAKELAEHMARKTEQVRAATLAELKGETGGTLRDLLAAFRSVLIADLTEERFADMFAQTLAYGLFAAWIQARQQAPSKDFTLESAGAYTPKTNPFLRKLFLHIANDLPPAVAEPARDLVELLNHAQMDAVLK